MRRKFITAWSLALLAIALAVHGGAAPERLPLIYQNAIEPVTRRVRFAFQTESNCRNLFAEYGGDPRLTLDRANFVYVGDALKPLGFAAATVLGTNQTLIGAAFYQNTADREGMATVVIHELLHQQGAGPEIDNYLENYEQISTACRTRNAAR